MNQKETIVQEQKNARSFNYQDRGHRNCIRINIGNSIPHEAKKFLKCFELQEQGHKFITEARLLNLEGRIDIIDLTDGIAYEVMESESKESIEWKRKVYPFPVETIK